MTKARAEADPRAAAVPGAAPGPFDTGRSVSRGGGRTDEEEPGTQPSPPAPAPAAATGGARPMNLLCSLGRHAPRAAPRWNDGYYFSTCRRCGQDIVRTAYEGWHVPRGYRIVWAASAPQDRPDVAMVPQEEAAAPETPPPAPSVDPATPAEPEVASDPNQGPEVQADEQHGEAVPEAAPAARKRRILPIEAVLARLREERAPDVEPPSGSPPAASSNRPYWDFMDEGPPPNVAAPAAPLATGIRAEVKVEPSRRQPRPPKPPRKPWLRQAIARMVRRLTPSEGNRPWVIAATAFVIAASVAVLAVTLSPPSAPQPGEVPIGETQPLFPAPASAAATAPGADAFVTASVLSCRAAPARQARRVRNLGRGDTVRILAREGEWVSIDHRGAQCWALARFVASERPLR